MICDFWNYRLLQKIKTPRTAGFFRVRGVGIVLFCYYTYFTVASGWYTLVHIRSLLIFLSSL